MSRGPPTKSIDVALPVAWARGYVIMSRRERGSVCTFEIHVAAYTAVVLVVRCRRLHGSLAEMETQYPEQLARLRLVPQGICRSLELWACSPYGGIRFFRVSGTGLVELGRDGGLPGSPATPGGRG